MAGGRRRCARATLTLGPPPSGRRAAGRCSRESGRAMWRRRGTIRASKIPDDGWRCARRRETHGRAARSAAFPPPATFSSRIRARCADSAARCGHRQGRADRSKTRADAVRGRGSPAGPGCRPRQTRRPQKSRAPPPASGPAVPAARGAKQSAPAATIAPLDGPSPRCSVLPSGQPMLMSEAQPRPTAPYQDSPS